MNHEKLKKVGTQEDVDIALDERERDLLESFEQDEWKSVPDLREELLRYRHHAEAHRRRTQSIVDDNLVSRGHS